MKSKIAVITTSWWPQAARLAMALVSSGADVSAICPSGSPVAVVNGVREVFHYAAFRPRRSLAASLRALRPDLVVPCDERSIAHLHALQRYERRHAGADSDFLCRLIERSLGNPQTYGATLDRGAVLSLAIREGVRVPPSRVLRSEAEVRAWCAERSLPALLKANGSWGGAGVILVDSAATAITAFRRMSRTIATWRALKFLLSNRDPFPLAEWLRRERRVVIGQDFMQGQAANIMVACWQGEVLATVSAIVLDTAKQFGAATVIQLGRHEGMEIAAERVVRGLGLSGFCGLDFVIAGDTGEAHLIELNPRATQLGHFQLAPGWSLASILLRRLRGETLPPKASLQTSPQTVAFFPQAWLSRSAAPLLGSAHHDVPWEEPELVAELLRRPWDIRSPLARLAGRLLRRPDPEKLLADCFADTRSVGQAG
jgi:glutathione synthase/RimK-type ligase-like ATP-grasp enzyme